MNKKITIILLLAAVAMTARAYTYYNNIEIGDFKYNLALGSSSSEENYANLLGLSNAGSSATSLSITGEVVYDGNSYRLCSVADSAFINNTTITSVTSTSNTAQKIGVRAFYGCTNLESVDMPIDTICDYAFCGSAIKSFEGTSALKYIGEGAFACTNNMTTVDLGSCTGLTVIPKYAFAQKAFSSSQSALSAHDTVNLPNSVTTIGKEAFYDNTFTAFKFPANLLKIESGAFNYSNLAGEVELPYGITTIEEDALSTWNVTKIVLPSTVTTVHSRFITDHNRTTPFRALSINLKTPLVFSNEGEDIFVTYQKLEYIPDTICVPVNYVDAWKTNPRWAMTNFHVYEGSYDFTGLSGNKYSILSFEPIGTGACQIVYNPGTYNNADTVIVGEAVDKYQRQYLVTEIGDKCFRNSTNLKTVYLTNDVQKIGNYAFYGSALTKIQDYASLTEETSISDGYVMPNVNYIGAFAFYNCKNLHELFLPHIDGKNSLYCGNRFFGDNADDFKCWVDYRRLGDFVNTNNWSAALVYPHLKLDSEWQSFACVKAIDFQNADVEAYVMCNYIKSLKTAALSTVTSLAAGNGGIVHGNADGSYYRLDYSSDGTSTNWLEGVTSSLQVVNSNSTNSYFKLNAISPEFNKVTTPTTFRRGYAYLKLSNSATDGATTITTSFVSDALPGDVNGDGLVSSVDITAIYNYLLNNDSSAIINGDQDGDGIISSVDITIIYNILLGQ